MGEASSGLMRRAFARYQGAIVRDGAVLLIQHREPSGRTYWLLPGGGMDPGETPEETVRREMREETGLEVRVEHLLLDLPSSGSNYEREHTYLCTPLHGAASPGFEPEFAEDAPYTITGVRWVPLALEEEWGAAIASDAITFGYLRRVRQALSE